MVARLFSVILFIFSANVSAEVLSTPPDSPDASKNYVFFMHGSGLFKSHADAAREKWKDKVNAIADKGFVVITEERQASWDDEDYVIKLSKQVDALIKKGVPAKNI